MERGGVAPRAAGLALASLLLLHGMAMNGGLEHLVECLGDKGFADGIQGFRFFGLVDLADVLQRALGEIEELECWEGGCGAFGVPLRKSTIGPVAEQ
jgi:hypothetical protein